MDHSGESSFEINLSPEEVKHLEEEARRQSMEPNQLAQVYIQESLRMADHPLIVFRDGPSGRRAAVMVTGDVWETVLVLRDNRGNTKAAAEYLQVPEYAIQAAAAYYAAFPQEIDAQIQANLEAENLAQQASQEGLKKLFSRKPPWADA